MTTARPLFEGRTTPRRLSELTGGDDDDDEDDDDEDDDDENEKQKTSILRVGATRAYAERRLISGLQFI